MYSYYEKESHKVKKVLFVHYQFWHIMFYPYKSHMYNSFQAWYCVGITLHNNEHPNIEQLEWDGIIEFSKENGYNTATLNGAFECKRNGILSVTEALRFRISEIIPSEASLQSLIMCSQVEIIQPKWWQLVSQRLHLLSHFEIGLTADDVKRYLDIMKKWQLDARDIEFIEMAQEKSKIHLKEVKERVLNDKNRILGVWGDLTLF